MNINIFKHMINLADQLDGMGFSKEADYIDGIITKVHGKGPDDPVDVDDVSNKSESDSLEEEILKVSFMMNPLDKIKELNTKLVNKPNAEFLKSILKGVERNVSNFNWNFPVYNSNVLRVNTYINNEQLVALFSFLIPKSLTFNMPIWVKYEIPLKELIVDSENSWNQMFEEITKNLKSSIAVKASGISVEDVINDAKSNISDKNKQDFFAAIDNSAEYIKGIFNEYPYLASALFGSMKSFGWISRQFGLEGRDIEGIMNACLKYMIDPVMPEIDQAVQNMYSEIEKKIS